MTNKITLAPDEIHQIAFEEGQPADNGDGYLFTAEEFDLFVQRLLDTALAEPVPPAGGDVEVLAWMYKRHNQSPHGKPSQHIALASDNINEVREGLVGVGIPCDNHFDWQPLVDRAHVTRLQAEVEEWRASNKENALAAGELVERLNSKIDTMRNKNNELNDTVAALQSELTKARELLAEWLSSNFTGSCPERNQSAPVDKGQGETVPKFKFDTLVEHCKRLERTDYELRAEVNDAWLYKENAVWFWQHDGEDYLKSLSCPVVIPAGQLRELLDGKAQHDPMAEQPAAVAVVMPDDIVRDAERYRILRDGGIPSTGIGDDYLGGVYVWDQRGEKYQECGKEISGDALDACLDEVARLNNLK